MYSYKIFKAYVIQLSASVLSLINLLLTYYISCCRGFCTLVLYALTYTDDDCVKASLGKNCLRTDRQPEKNVRGKFEENDDLLSNMCTLASGESRMASMKTEGRNFASSRRMRGPFSLSASNFANRSAVFSRADALLELQ